MTEEHVVLLIRSLDVGGAERQVAALAAGLRRQGVAVTVVTFYEGGAFEAELHEAGVPCCSAGKRGRWDVVRFFLRLVRLLRRLRPSVLYSFLTTANLLAVLAKPLLPRTHFIWGLRASDMDMARYDWLSRLTSRIEPQLARWVDRIISNSEAGRLHAVAQGFPSAKLLVVPNGIDSERFQFDEIGRRRVRAEWQVREDERIVGLAARLDPMKDHANFLTAAALVNRDLPDVWFVCIGGGPIEARLALQDLVRKLEPRPKVIWCGERRDMSAVLSALDVACSASAFGEGFSNAIAEAMSCGVPCVATAVGDAAALVGETGIVVPPSDPLALARAILSLLSRPPATFDQLRVGARQRVRDSFSVEALVRRTRATWASP